jgi:very-short-patch-repair endonuclease
VGGMPRSGSKLRKKDMRVPRARSLRREMTETERRLWWHLRGLKVKGTHFRRQATIGPYFADFACHERKLVVELDGSGHLESNRSAADKVRTRFLESRGYRVLRFWNNEVLTNTDGVMTVIYDALNGRASSAPPPLTPPHHAQGRAGGGDH